MWYVGEISALPIVCRASVGCLITGVITVLNYGWQQRSIGDVVSDLVFNCRV